MSTESFPTSKRPTEVTARLGWSTLLLLEKECRQQKTHASNIKGVRSLLTGLIQPIPPKPGKVPERRVHGILQLSESHRLECWTHRRVQVEALDGLVRCWPTLLLDGRSHLRPRLRVRKVLPLKREAGDATIRETGRDTDTDMQQVVSPATVLARPSDGKGERNNETASRSTILVWIAYRATT